MPRRSNRNATNGARKQPRRQPRSDRIRTPRNKCCTKRTCDAREPRAFARAESQPSTIEFGRSSSLSPHTADDRTRRQRRCTNSTAARKRSASARCSARPSSACSAPSAGPTSVDCCELAIRLKSQTPQTRQTTNETAKSETASEHETLPHPELLLRSGTAHPRTSHTRTPHARAIPRQDCMRMLPSTYLASTSRASPSEQLASDGAAAANGPSAARRQAVCRFVRRRIARCLFEEDRPRLARLLPPASTRSLSLSTRIRPSTRPPTRTRPPHGPLLTCSL